MTVKTSVLFLALMIAVMLKGKTISLLKDRETLPLNDTEEVRISGGIAS